MAARIFCDQCGVETKDYYDVVRTSPIASSWIYYGTNTTQDHENTTPSQHFCSLGCLRKWAKKEGA